MVFYIGPAVLAVLAIYCWLGIKKAYENGKTLPFHVSAAIWILDTFHLILVIVASVFGVWEFDLNGTATLIGGSVLVVFGLAILLIGMIEFRSLRRISGMDSERLISTGIYQWSRNPQYLGWYICLAGISLMGRCGLALLLTAVLIAGIHVYNIWLEEPYLEKTLGKGYREYKSRTPRYIGVPRSSRNADS